MSPRPSLPHGLKGMGGTLIARLLASALAAGALLTTAACSDGGDGGPAALEGSASPVAGESRAAKPLTGKTPSPSGAFTSAGGALTAAGAQAALITEADIEDDWSVSKDAASWHESLLVGTVDVSDFVTGKSDAADCQKLMDSLYDDDLLGKPSGASALTGFQQGDARLLYQVAAYDKSSLDSSFDWLKSLPAECDGFTMTDGPDQRTVEVIETSVPDEGDARQGLRVTVQGTADGEPATLTLDVGAVRVGTDAITVTSGGLSGDENTSFQQAFKEGTERLEDVLKGKTPSPDPGEVD
ncbi:hypothetical protein [Streptomyces luteolifulvus]